MTDSIHAPFDRVAVRRHRDRAAAGFDGSHDFLFREVADRLLDRLDDLKRRFPVALDLGCRTGGIADLIQARGGIETLIQLDLSPAMAMTAARRRLSALEPFPCRWKQPGQGVALTLPAARPWDAKPPALPDAKPWGTKSAAENALVACGDPEFLPIRSASLDLAVSCLDLHWVNDLPGALIQLRRALKPDGLLLAALFGLDTLPTLRTALADAEIAVEGGLSPRMSPFTDVRDAGGLLQRAGFALPVVDAEIITVNYPTPLHLMQDLRGMAETNAVAERRKTFSRRATLLRAAQLYAERHSDADGRVTADFQILTLTGWVPDERQQKPLRPGSASQRLATALDSEEQSAGEKTGG